MTGKRFTVIDHNEWSEGDIIYYDDGEEMGWMDVCDKLNELHEKNQDNEAMIEFLSTENTQIWNELKTRTQIQHQLEKENEQLKKYIEEHSIDERLLDDLYFNQVEGI